MKQARIETETRLEKLERVSAARKEATEKAIEEGLKEWEPSKDTSLQSDPFKTLFVGRLSYDITEKKLMREFEEFGPIKSVSIVQTKYAQASSSALTPAVTVIVPVLRVARNCKLLTSSACFSISNLSN